MINEYSTDQERTVKFLDALGVGYDVQIREDSVYVHIVEGYDKVEGYRLFFADFKFNLDGSFIKIIIGE